MSRPNVLHCVIALAGLALAAAAVGAEPPTPAAAPSTLSTATTSEDLICRDRLRPGSHIAMRTCLTRAQWAVARARGSLRAPYATTYPHEGMNISTVGASVGMSGFTQR